MRFTDKERRRLAVKAKKLGRKALGEGCCLLTPDTLLRWYRELVAKKYDGRKNRSPGRPRIDAEIRDLIVQMAKENSGWGYTRIKGALKNLSIIVDRTTFKRVLEEHGIEPAPDRNKGMSWETFLKVHFGEIAAADFFAVEALTVFLISETLPSAALKRTDKLAPLRGTFPPAKGTSILGFIFSFRDWAGRKSRDFLSALLI